jgi:hypothetical protein
LLVWLAAIVPQQVFMAHRLSVAAAIALLFAVHLVAGFRHHGGFEDYVPQQVRLSYGSSISEMRVTWASHDEGKSFVHYGFKPNAMSMSVRAHSTFWTNGNLNGTQWVYKASLKVGSDSSNHGAHTHTHTHTLSLSGKHH